MNNHYLRRILTVITVLSLLLPFSAAAAYAEGGAAISEELFPDPVFREYVAKYDKNGDGFLSEAEISAVKFIFCDNKEISSFDGIELFTSLEDFSCSSCGLTELDLSGVPWLKELDCSRNQLEELDLSNNTELNVLFCYGNKLQILDVSNNTALTMLLCNDNGMKGLRIGNCTALNELEADGNLLTELDISGNPMLLFVVRNGEEFETSRSFDFQHRNPNGRLTLDKTTVLILDGGKRFVDVKQGAYYEEAVDWATENGVTSGTDLIHFSPEAECTRGQFVTFIWRASGSPEPTGGENPFEDVSPKRYYYKAVLWAYENGIVKGVSKDSFSPGSVCTRGEAVTFIWRLKGSPEPHGEATVFSDVKDGAFYYVPVAWAVESEVTKGVSDTLFDPGGMCKRGQTVTFLKRASE